MRKVIISILFFSILNLNAQEKNELIELKNNSVFKLYLDRNLHFIKENCATYYTEFSFTNDFFNLKDSLKIFYKENNSIYLKGFYSNNSRNGKFIWYYSNGKISCEGFYIEDEKSGIWKYYYENGSIRKVIDFNKNPRLMEFYNDNGIKLIENGNGHFVDIVYTNPMVGNVKNDGKITDGFLDGEWSVFIKNKLVFKELFEKGNFIRGVSNSTFGEEPYNGVSHSTFTDFIPLEYFEIENASKKCNLVGTIISSKGKNNFSELLENNFSKINPTPIIPNYWFFALLKFNKNNNLKNVEIFTNRNDLDKQIFINWIMKSYSESNKINAVWDDKLLIPIQVKNGKLYLGNL